MTKVYFEISDPSSGGILQVTVPIFYHEAHGEHEER